MGCCPSKARAQAETAHASAGVGAEKPVEVGVEQRGNANATLEQQTEPPPELVQEEEEKDEERFAAAVTADDVRTHLAATGRRGSFQLDVDKLQEVANGAAACSSSAPPSLALRSPARTPANFEDVPISSTYHRVHSATVADKEARRRDEERLEAEQREREVREYKAALTMQPAVQV